MTLKECYSQIYGVLSRLRKTGQISMSMRLRLFVFLLVLVITMILGVIIILLLTGYPASSGEAERFVRKELSYITRNISAQCGDTSVQLVLLSESLSKSMEYQLSNRQIPINELQKHSEILEDIIGNELSRLQLALEKTKCSGVFMVLDATFNPTLANADNSRVGLYLRNSEPNVAGPDTTRLYLRGFPAIALQNGLLLQSKWDMEFDVKSGPFYQLPIEKYNETALPLSRLYYWSFEGAIPDLGEDVILCSVPLIDSNGNVFGVCGFEISEMNFKLNFSPDGSVYKHIVCMLSQLNEAGMDTKNALFSGDRTVVLNNKQYQGPLAFAGGGNELNIYTWENGKAFVGLHEAIKLYPSDSAFADRRIVAALLIPKEEMDASMSKLNRQLVLVCVLLLFLGVGGSFYLSQNYLKPIVEAFDTIRADKLDDTAKTNILEIDQLIEKIKALHPKENRFPDNLFEDFIERVKTLTPTERDIFRYYFEGKSNNEILSLMFISVNTLKVHNRHIYTKLNISSKNELMLYIELIKKSGLTAEII